MTKPFAPHLLPVSADDLSFTRAQFVDGRRRRQAPDEQVRAGLLLRAAPSVFLLPDAKVAARAHAAVEHAGPGAVVTGWAACALYGLKYVEDRGAVPVLVPNGRNRVSTQHVRVVRTRRMPDTWTTASGICLARPARALVDLSRAETDLRTARSVLLHAVSKKVVTEAELRCELDAGRLNGSALTRRVLGDAVRGAASSPEAEMCDSLLAEAGPGLELLLNPWIYLDGELLGSVDGLIRGTGLGYECDSWEHHASDGDAERTLVRSDRYTASGMQLLHRSPARYRKDPVAWARTVLRAAEARRGMEPKGLIIKARGPLLPATDQELYAFRTGALRIS